LNSFLVSHFLHSQLKTNSVIIDCVGGSVEELRNCGGLLVGSFGPRPKEGDEIGILAVFEGSASCTKQSAIPDDVGRTPVTFTGIEGDWKLINFHTNGAPLDLPCGVTSKISKKETDKYNWFVKVVNGMRCNLSKLEMIKRLLPGHALTLHLNLLLEILSNKKHYMSNNRSATCTKQSAIPDDVGRTPVTFTGIEGDWKLVNFQTNGAPLDLPRRVTSKISKNETDKYNWFVKVVNNMRCNLSKVDGAWKTSPVASTLMLGPKECMNVEHLTMAQWITDGSIGFTVDGNVVTLADPNYDDCFFNAMWQEGDGVSSGKHYWKIQFPTLASS
ncbi:hypothetical protein Bhyg_11938, partial [Pseudolycoriella hygida]